MFPSQTAERVPAVGMSMEELSEVAAAEAKQEAVVAEQVEIQVKYEGYINRQIDEVARREGIDDVALPPDMDYSQVVGLSKEVQQKLGKHRQNRRHRRIPRADPAGQDVVEIPLPAVRVRFAHVDEQARDTEQVERMLTRHSAAQDIHQRRFGSIIPGASRRPPHVTAGLFGLARSSFVSHTRRLLTGSDKSPVPTACPREIVSAPALFVDTSMPEPHRPISERD